MVRFRVRARIRGWVRVSFRVRVGLGYGLRTCLPAAIPGLRGKHMFACSQYLFLNLESEEMPSLAIVDTYQPLGPIQYPSEVMGSRGGSLWKLSDFSNLNSKEILL